MSEFSPVAQAVYNAVLEINPAPANEIAATALRAAADQVCPSDAIEPRNYLPMAIENDRIRRELLVIADELKGVKYGTYRCDLEANE